MVLSCSFDETTKIQVFEFSVAAGIAEVDHFNMVFLAETKDVIFCDER